MIIKESDLHTKRTGHTEFVDKTADTVKPISLEVPKVTASESEEAVGASSQAEGTLPVECFVYLEVVFSESMKFYLIYLESFLVQIGWIGWIFTVFG